MFERIRAKLAARRARRGVAPAPPQPGPITPGRAPARRPGLLQRIAMDLLKKLLATAPNAIKGQIDLTELWKAVLTAVGGSGLLGLLIAVLTAVSNNLALILPNPIIASLVGYIILQLIELLRRQAAGQTPLQLSTGTPVPTSGTFVPRPDLGLPADGVHPPFKPAGGFEFDPI